MGWLLGWLRQNFKMILYGLAIVGMIVSMVLME